MKKLALAVAVTGALGATSANALTLSQSGNGVLVPLVTFVDDFTMGTAISLNTCAAGVVYWTFFDPDTIKVLDGEFPMTPYDQYPFIWADEAGLGLSGEIGYMTFVLDSDGNGYIDVSDLPCLSGNAFQVNLPHLDVAFQPVLPIQAALGDLGAPVGGIYTVPPITGETELAGLSAGYNAHDILFMRYAIDNIPREEAHNTLDTTIWIWSASDISGLHGSGNEVNLYNDNQERRSIQLDLPNAELNWVDPEEILGRPVDFIDGFIAWQLPQIWNGQYVTGVVSWSVVDSAVFQAEQTLIVQGHRLDQFGNFVYLVHEEAGPFGPSDAPQHHNEDDGFYVPPVFPAP